MAWYRNTSSQRVHVPRRARGRMAQTVAEGLAVSIQGAVADILLAGGLDSLAVQVVDGGDMLNALHIACSQDSVNRDRYEKTIRLLLDYYRLLNFLNNSEE